MANLNLNKVILGGRLTADPELKQTASGTPVTAFSVAVSRKYAAKAENGTPTQPTADFINCVAWRNTAEFISKYFQKGSMIAVTGSIQTRNYEDKNGNIQPHKTSKSTRRIDGTAALLDAYTIYDQKQAEYTSML